MAALDLIYRRSPNFFDVTREEAEKYLEEQPNRTFLLRKSSREGCLVITLKQNDKVLHLLVIKGDDGYKLDPTAWKKHDVGKQVFQTVDALIHKLKQLQLLKKGLTVDDIENQLVTSEEKDELGAKAKAEMKKILDSKSRDAELISKNLEAEYRGMLRMMIKDNRVEQSELAQLAEWRNRNAFTEEQHQQVLSSLGMTVEQFDELKKSETMDDKDACVVCLDAIKATVFIDCGHMATCVKCADLVNECPLCRKPKTKYIRVFT